MSLLQFFGCLAVAGALLPLVIVAFLYVEDGLARCLQAILRSVSIGRSGRSTGSDHARDAVSRPSERGGCQGSCRSGSSAYESARPGTLDRSRNAQCWREAAEGILLEDEAIRLALAGAEAALDGDRGRCADGHDHVRLDAIGNYSALVAGRARAVTRTIDYLPPDIERIASLGCPHEYLRTLRVLGDVLRTTARRPFVPR